MSQNVKQVGKLFFHESTNDKVCEILNRYNTQNRDQRIRVFYGDTETGRCWMDEYDVLGYVGCSTGPVKIPLLINNKSSYGGGAILDHCIIKITVDKRTIYQHPLFYMPVITVDGKSVLFDGKVYANAHSEQSAQRLADFYQGKRNNK